MITRRQFVNGGAFSIVAAALISPAPALGTMKRGPIELTAKTGEAHLRGTDLDATSIWGYNGQVPGPLLRIKEGEEVWVRLKNNIAKSTTLHWHGIRIDNRMDGVPKLTQAAVEPGQTFEYRFTPPDPGTYWYHPHIHSSEEVARGMYGMLIVEEREPPKVDREILIVVDDWRLAADGQIDGSSFGAIGERAHAGRIGNTHTVNGREHLTIDVKVGERLRLRLCNVANADILAVSFQDHEPHVIAIDGQPVKPFQPDKKTVVLSPAQRADVIIDMSGKPGQTSTIQLATWDRQISIGTLRYHATERKRENALDAAITLPLNPALKFDKPADAKVIDFVMDGGAMGRMRAAWVGDEWLGMRELIQRHGYVWAFNGVAGMPETPLFDAKRGELIQIKMQNRTSWPHAMHLHGHHAIVLDGGTSGRDNGLWRDTVLVEPDEIVSIGLVADNPGKWMFHCHMLEHQEGGMATWFKVET